ncbi:uncharacterized protein METZ01_LOCUS294941 [marine metagenome]|uniref:Uncharacterized protein n=1 Tax=marine metagenome TaxID=408172 RepID=A0A382M322_9ZZZZ
MPENLLRHVNVNPPFCNHTGSPLTKLCFIVDADSLRRLSNSLSQLQHYENLLKDPYFLCTRIGS